MYVYLDTQIMLNVLYCVILTLIEPKFKFNKKKFTNVGEE